MPVVRTRPPPTAESGQGAGVEDLLYMLDWKVHPPDGDAKLSSPLHLYLMLDFDTHTVPSHGSEVLHPSKLPSESCLADF